MEIDFSSPTWRSVEQKCEGRIEEIRDKLENASPEDVPRLQGEITSLRYILNLKDNAPGITVTGRY